MTRVRSAVWRTGQFARVRAGRVAGRIGRPEPTTTGVHCDDVAAWAARHQGARPRRLSEAREVVRRPPRTLDPVVSEFFARRAPEHHPARDLVPVDGARVVGAAGMVVLPDGSVAVESLVVPRFLDEVPELVAPRRVPVQRRPGDHFSLLVPWAQDFNHYHWCHDSLLRLHDVLDHLPSDTHFLVPGWLRPVQLETLSLLGIGRDRLVPVTGLVMLELGTLHHVGQGTVPGSHEAAAERWLSDRFRAATGCATARTGRRVYVSRRSARRATVNEAAVVALLDEFGFEVVVAEALSVGAQVQRFAEAAVIVGGHGAGLYNMVHAAPGAVVVDMVDRYHLEYAPVFRSLAEELGHEYWYLTTDIPVDRGPQSDSVVPVEQLEATLLAAGLDRRRTPAGGPR
ncbi:MAG: glycosyltransferase family 61 protein [Actinomycetota bacterium]